MFMSLKAVAQKGCALRFAAKELRSSPRLVASAVQSDASAILLAGCDLRKRSALLMQEKKDER